MSFEQALTFSFIDGNPGNASVYVSLIRAYPHLKEWTEDCWIVIRNLYYTTEVTPGSAWLHDIHKNKHHFDLQKTYDLLIEMRAIIEDY